MATDAFGKDIKPRSKQQNKAMHKYFEEVADLLNESGISHEAFLEHLTLDYSKEQIKDIWRSIAHKKFGLTSTADLTTKQLQDVYEEFNRHLSQFGLHVPFPSFNADYDEAFLREQGLID